MRFGLLSTARINDRVIAAARVSDEVEIVAVGSRDAARAEAYARRHEIARAHGSYEALLADPDVDAVYVSLPNGMHVDWSIAALEAGKHVLCEKPLARTAADAERAFDVAERVDRVLMEAFMWRFQPQTRLLSELVAEGAVGRLRVVRTSFSFLLERPGDVRLEPALDGGALMDVGCYCLSAIRLFAGEPERVQGEQVLGGNGVDVAFGGVLRCPDDVLAVFDAAFTVPRRHDLELVGEEGTLVVPDPWFAAGGAFELRRGGVVREFEVERVDAYRLELENVAAAARGEAAPLLGRGDAVGQARAIEALYAAAAAYGNGGDEGVGV